MEHLAAGETAPEAAEYIHADPAHAASGRELAPRAVHRQILDFAMYWLRLRPAPGMLPSRRHVDPLEVPRLLPILYLIDVQRGPPIRFRWRLRGTELVDAVGTDYTGMFLDEAHPRFKGSHAESHFIAIADGASCWWLGPPTSTTPADVSHVERLVLPLASDGRNVDMLIGATIFTLSH